MTSPRSVSQLEFPMPERLLPVGPQRETVLGLIERVRQALGVTELEGTFQISIRISKINKIYSICLDSAPQSLADTPIDEKKIPNPQKQDSIASEILVSHLLSIKCFEKFLKIFNDWHVDYSQPRIWCQAMKSNRADRQVRDVWSSK